jgi:hypothetical protein
LSDHSASPPWLVPLQRNLVRALMGKQLQQPEMGFDGHGWLGLPIVPGHEPS